MSGTPAGAVNVGSLSSPTMLLGLINNESLIISQLHDNIISARLKTFI